MTEKLDVKNAALLPTKEMIGEECGGAGAQKFNEIALTNFAVHFSENDEGRPVMSETRSAFYQDTNAALDLLEG